ncbi:molybdate ABC transporter substrate-binding protein [Kineococcus sp. SYSU DK006]|uniref:molybdate ABC transporter substrate-binding protein n=1 Tax=Kineococcus sp. SYSU DK006 TaxID=3383127 RepID=UPI003D7D532F
MRARPARRAASRPAAAVLAAGLLLGACAPSGGASAGAQDERTLTVFAAASLREPFTAIGERFEQAHPGVRVTSSFAGSSDLVSQVVEGAPADVLASADERTMAQVVDASLTAGEPVDVATNVLQIATPPGNPAGITSFADLARPGARVVLCAPQVPCGSAARTLQERTGVDLAPVSEESSVTDVLGKVVSGEADAGLVYVTDVAAAGDAVTGVPFPEAAGAVNTYPVAALREAADADLARRFVEFVAGEQGRSALRAAGFGVPAA